VVNLVVWLHILLGASWCMSIALFGMRLMMVIKPKHIGAVLM